MPYANVPENLWEKMDSCVKQVQDKDPSLDKSAAVAICYTTIVEGKSEAMQAFEDALKIGARNSRKDAADIQTAHDLMQRLGAKCDAGDVMQQMTGSKSADLVDDDILISFGDEVKATLINGTLEVGAYGIRFGKSSEPDLTGRDWFGDDTDFGPSNGNGAAVMVHHGLPIAKGLEGFNLKTFKNPVQTTKDKIGIFVKHLIDMGDEYEKAIGELIISRRVKMRWSSGAAGHAVIRDDTTGQIKMWLPAEFSYTPAAAEYRLPAIVPLKSYQPTMLEIEALPQAEQENRDGAQTLTAASDQSNQSEGKTMSEELEAIKALTDRVGALETTIKNAPPLSTIPAATVKVVTDPADVPFKSLSEMCRAVKSFELSKGQKVHPRLTNPALKTDGPTGANETVPNEGGFLLDPTLTTQFLAPTHEVGQFSNMVNRLPVGTNSNYGWINGIDESDRATGSRWGGIRGYRLNEGKTKTASQPKFRRINWELKKYAVLVYGTDELLQDAAQFSAIVRQGVSEEIAFMLNDDIVNGSGAGGPFGFLSAPCLVSVTKETNQAAATVVFENLMKMWQRLLPASKRSSGTAWFINSEVAPQLDSLSLAAGTAALPPRFVDYGADGVMRIKGKPVYETEFNAALGTVGDIVLADMSQYLVWEKAGIQEATSIHVQFLTDETVFRFVYRVDGQPALHSAVTPYKGSATQSHFVAIETRS